MTIQAQIFSNNSTTYTQSLYQHDRNVTLVFEGIDLPGKYEVHFSNQKDSGISVACEGSSSGVVIPDALLSTGEYVYAWVCEKDEETGFTCQFMVVIPVIPRPVPVPIQVVHDGSDEKWEFEVNADEENLTFINSPDGMIKPVVEPND